MYVQIRSLTSSNGVFLYIIDFYNEIIDYVYGIFSIYFAYNYNLPAFSCACLCLLTIFMIVNLLTAIMSHIAT